MNWLLIFSVGLLIMMGMHGYRKGFIRKTFSLLAMVLSIALVSMVSPYISDFIQYNTSIYDSLKETCAGILYTGEGSFDNTTQAGQEQLIGSSYLPASVKERLVSENTASVYQMLGATGFNDYVGGYIAKMIINAISFIVAFLVVFIALRIVIRVLDLFAKLPILNGINRTAGMAMGVVQALLIIWIGFVVITIFSNQEIGRICYQYINDSAFLSALYNYNILMRFIAGFL